jgi:hypothetical protein
MNAMTFDTHAAAKEFESAGFTAEQVDALVNVSRQTTSLPDVSTLATKSDISELRAELRAEISGAKLQAITVILSGMAVITALGTILSRFLR